MESAESWFRFVLAVFAVWRITHLLAREDGPGDVLVRLRVRLGDGFWGRLMDCFYCLSVWIAAPFAFFVCAEWIPRVVAWLAISGAACLLERVTREPVAIQPLPDAEREENHGMLRPETERLEKPESGYPETSAHTERVHGR